MKPLFGESIPRPLGACFPDSIEIGTVQRMARAGRSNGELLRLVVEHGFDAFITGSFWLLHALEEPFGWLRGVTCLVCERFLDRFADEAKDVRTHRAADRYTLAKLVFQTYQQHQNDEWTSRSLDLIDRLCLEGIGDATRELEQFER